MAEMTVEKVVETLRRLNGMHEIIAAELLRLQDAGVDLKRRDGKDMDRWIAEELSSGGRLLDAAHWYAHPEDWWDPEVEEDTDSATDPDC